MNGVDTDCYLTKMDLIDTHPKIFEPGSKENKISDVEREQLRQFVIGKRQLFKSRLPTGNIMDKDEFIKQWENKIKYHKKKE